MNMAKKDRIYYGWVVVVAFLFIGIISYGINYSYGVFFKSLLQHFDWSRTLTSGLFSSYMLLQCVFAILGGWTLDRYGARIVFILMGFFTGLSLLLTSHANAPWHLFVSYSLLLAIGIGPIYTVTMATAARWFVVRRGLALGIVGAGAGLGIAAMTPIAAHLVSTYGWQNAYFIMGLVALATITPCALVLRKTPTAVTPLADGESLTDTSHVVSQKQNPDGSDSFSLIQAVKTRNFWLLLSVWFLYAFCLHLVLVHLTPHAIDLGTGPMKAATFLGLIGGISIPGRIFMGRFSDIIGRKQAGIISALFMAGAMLLLAVGSKLWLLYLFSVIFGLSYGGIDPPIVALIGDAFGTRHMGVILGVLVVGWSAGGAAGPALAGYIFDVSGNYVYAFLAAMVAMVIATILIFLVRQSRR